MKYVIMNNGMTTGGLADYTLWIKCKPSFYGNFINCNCVDFVSNAEEWINSIHFYAIDVLMCVHCVAIELLNDSQKLCMIFADHLYNLIKYFYPD